jgi:hypothetical protein
MSDVRKDAGKWPERLKEIDRLSHSASEKDVEYILIHHRPIIWALLAAFREARAEAFEEAEEYLNKHRLAQGDIKPPIAYFREMAKAAREGKGT